MERHKDEENETTKRRKQGVQKERKPVTQEDGVGGVREREREREREEKQR